MIRSILLGVVFALSLRHSVSVQFPIMDVPELIEYWGYEVETHTVVTIDLYILNMHRIPSKNPNATAVFLQHGLFGSSARFVTGPPNKSLAFILSDLGYDVWMGNTRGNTYSRQHMQLDPDRDIEQYWNFDWDVAGRGDLPISLERIQYVTGQEKIFYIGHSMGSTEFLVVASEDPSFQDGLYAAFLMAPPAWMGGHVNDTLAKLSEHWRLIENAFEVRGIWEVLPDNELTSQIGHETCDDEHFEENEEKCMRMSDLFFMVSPGELNTTMLPIYFDVYPEGSSVKPLVHYGQLIDSAIYFRKYDMGTPMNNMDAYGTPEPPDYDLDKITLPTYLFYGDGDSLVIMEDVETLAEHLPNNQLLYLVPHHGWTHNDFVYAIDAPDLLYNVITEEMDKILDPTDFNE